MIEEHTEQGVSIKVMGVGGAGSNTVNNIIESGWKGIEFSVINTDAQALEQSKASHKIQIGVKSTKGLGSGTDPELGKRAAEEDIDKILEIVGDADIVFLAAGMGGGTGSGAMPVIARALRGQGILTIAIVTKPFAFEGKRRARVAHDALELLKKEVDTLIVIPNQKLLEIVDEKASMIDAFARINEILSQSIRGISDIITKPGHINVDFADVKTIVKDRGLAVMGNGRAVGPNRAREATLQAIESPLLENMSIEGARGVLLNITGNKNLGLHEISEAASLIYERADEDANIILGSVIDETMGDEICVTIIATGFAPKKIAVQESVAPVALEVVSAVAEAMAGQGIQEQKIKGSVLDNSETSVEKVVEGSSEASLHHEETFHDEKLMKSAHEDLLGAAELDVTDLDVPAYLRRDVSEKSKGE